MKHLVMLFVFVAVINKNEAGAQASHKLAMNAVMTTIYTGKENDDLPGDNIADINSRAVKHFTKKFRKAMNVKWMVLTDGFLAKFNDDHSSQRIFYYDNGSLAGSIKGYDAAFLPKEIKQVVKEKYSGYKVMYVNEAELAQFESSPTFIVQLQGKKDFKVVRICDDLVDEINELGKVSNKPARF